MNGYPMYMAHQRFDGGKIDDIGSAVQRAIREGKPAIRSGARIAITVGSRGIANLESIVRATVSELREIGAKPFIIPAMGSHGGATAEGQIDVLASYGITKERVGAEIRSTMEVVEVSDHGLDHRVFMDRYAWESDGVLLLNRVKPHTDFHGRWESGLVKMSVIGLGKQRQAEEIHSFGVHGLRDLIPPTAKAIIETGKVVGGIGVVENSYDETMLIEAASANQVMDLDAKLLDQARANMPRLPLDRIDVLIVDVMGKDKSGCGVDTNIIGRMLIRGEEEPAAPDVATIVITDLSEASHGNAIGVGLGDVITRRLFDKIDFQATYANSVTSTFLDRSKVPLIAETDMEALEVALRAAGCRSAHTARVVRIRSTLELSELMVSEAAKAAMSGNGNTKVSEDKFSLFNGDGTLIAFPER